MSVNGRTMDTNAIIISTNGTDVQGMENTIVAYYSP